jgi:hypothetical protein
MPGVSIDLAIVWETTSDPPTSWTATTLTAQPIVVGVSPALVSLELSHDQPDARTLELSAAAAPNLTVSFGDDNREVVPPGTTHVLQISIEKAPGTISGPSGSQGTITITGTEQP